MKSTKGLHEGCKEKIRYERLHQTTFKLQIYHPQSAFAMMIGSWDFSCCSLMKGETMLLMRQCTFFELGERTNASSSSTSTTSVTGVSMDEGAFMTRNTYSSRAARI